MWIVAPICSVRVREAEFCSFPCRPCLEYFPRASAPVPEAEPLRRFFHLSIAPFLTNGGGHASPLRHPGRAAALFLDLKTKLAPEAFETVDTLESLCEQRRQLDRQAQMHFWLHSWLWLHLPLSVALVALMFVHVWFALKYW